MRRLAERIVLLDGWRRALLAVFAGAVAALGLAPVNLIAAGFLAFPLLVLLLDGAAGDPGRSWLRRLLPAFRIGWLFGFGYFVAGLWWLGAAMLNDGDAFLWAIPLAVLVLPAILALYFGLGAMLARAFWSDGSARILVLAGSLSAVEVLRGLLFTGFPWNEIGMLAAPVPLLMQSVSVVGLHGLTLGAVIVFSAPVLLVLGGRGRLALGLALVLVAAHLGYGAWRLQTAETRFVDNVRLRVVQPNIPQTEKWDEAEADRIFDRLITLTEMRGETPAAGEATPTDAAPAVEGLSGEGEGATATGSAPALPETPPRTLVIWPESAFPFLLTDRPDAIARLADVLQPGETLIAGAARVEYVAAGRPLVYNSVYVIDDNGEIRDARDKVHLVPFGEYLPFQAFLEGLGFRQLAKLPGGFSAGPERHPVPLEGLPSFLPLICYEIIFQDEIKATDGAGFIVNVTNDAWYGATPGPYQHLRQAEISAVAFGLPLVRSANTGISVVSDGFGRVVEGLALGSAGVVASGLPQALPPTIFSRQGNALFWYLFATTWALGWACAVRNARED